jgi:hypothetical protein
LEQDCVPYLIKIGSRNRDLLAKNKISETANESSTLKNRWSIGSAAPLIGGFPETCESHTNRKRQSSFSSIPVSDSMLTPTLCVPCKLLKYLTANPSADLTQMPIASDGEEWNSDVVDDGIPCSRAYRMLIHYTTTEPKLDAVAHVLERGCVPNVGPGGGCRVKSKTIWKALDDICL